MYSKPTAKPNQQDVAQILDVEFEARRAFIDVDVIREEDWSMDMPQRPQRSEMFEMYFVVFLLPALELLCIRLYSEF